MGTLRHLALVAVAPLSPGRGCSVPPWTSEERGGASRKGRGRRTVQKAAAATIPMRNGSGHPTRARRQPTALPFALTVGENR